MPKIYTIQELKKELRLSERTIFNYLKEGRLTGSKHGKWLFTDNDVKAFLVKGRKNSSNRKK